MWKSIRQRINEKFASSVKSTDLDQQQLIKLALVEMEQTIFNTGEALTVAIGNQKNLELTAKQHLREAEKWKKDVADAIRIGDDGQGGKSLEYYKNSAKMHEEYKLLAAEAGRPIQELKIQLDSLKQKLAEVKASDALLSAQKTVTVAENTIPSKLLTDFELIEQKVSQEQKNMEAIIVSEPKYEPVALDTPVSVATINDFELLKAKFFEENKSGLVKHKEKITTFFEEKKQQLTRTQENLINSFFKDNALAAEFSKEKQKQIDDFFTKE
jgi:phage shock protein A